MGLLDDLVGVRDLVGKLGTAVDTCYSAAVETQAELDWTAAELARVSADLDRLRSTVPLVTGLAARDTPRPELPIYHVRLRWRDLEPEPGAFRVDNAVEQAIASGYLFRVRFDCGRYAPDWVKARGSVTLYEPQGGLTATVPRWWTEAYASSYERALRFLASRYDGVIPALFAGGAMTFWNEPCIRQLGSAENRRALLEAGYTWEADIDAQLRFIELQHDLFRRTRPAYAFNPYQRLNADGTWTPDLELTRRLMEAVRQNPGAIVQSNSLRSPIQSAYAELYAMMREFGHPLSFQTAALTRVGDLDATVDTAISWGAHLVELPDGGMCSDPALRAARLTRNAL